METLTARLESFNAAHTAGKKRASNAKAVEKIRWPHKTPTPTQLAKAGFFFSPGQATPDNTICFHCHASLDGWEEDDNAIEQHCKLSPSCAWNIITRIEQNIEYGDIPQDDPMDKALLEARRSTFANWPHEDKRGWLCKTQKMIESGWYYCPTKEGDDLTSCCYCSLTLDGWEPKDDPRVEHQRRSPQCIFFALSTTKAKKTARGNKGRGSKGSRMSIQSNLTAASGDITMTDVNEIEDATSAQDLETAGATKNTKGTKKGAKGKSVPPKNKHKTPRSLQDGAAPGISFVEPEDDDFEVKIEQKPTQETKGRKRKSDEMSIDMNSSQLRPQPGLSQTQSPPSKRRATRNSVSHGKKDPISTLEFNLDGDSHLATAEEVTLPQPKSKKTAKGGRKRASSTIRKASAASTASKASLRAPVPDDDDIDAALEADLDRPLTDDEAERSPPPLPKTKTRRLTKTRPGSRKVTASTAPVRKVTRASTLPAEQDSSFNADMSNNDVEKGVNEEAKAAEIALNAVEHAKEEILAQTDEHVASKAKIRSKGISKSAKTKKKGVKTRKQDDEPVESHVLHEEVLVERKASSGPEIEQNSNQPTANDAHLSELSIANGVDDGECQMDSSVIIPISTHEDTGGDTVANVGKPKPANKGGKKRTAPVKKGKASVRKATPNHELEEAIQTQPDDAGQGKSNVVTEGEEVIEYEHTEQPTLPGSAPVEEALRGKDKAGRSKKGTAAKHQADGMLSPAATSSFERPDTVEAAEMTSQPQALDLNTITPPESQFQGAEVETIVQSTIPPAPTPPVQETPSKSVSPQSSDAENRPPSTRPSALRPPLTVLSPSKPQNVQVAFNAATPTTSPHKRDVSRLQSTLPWAAIDFQNIFMASPASEKENAIDATIKDTETQITSPEKKLTVEEWMTWRAERGEEKLRKDCERLVGRFENEGVRALKSLEGIVCAE
ncbi:MAG: hypothetical protein LQ350_003996 [Teloschistes chrysophthalmus]|nr:MAG: hypothetical protein LQ350_003996 [Niorma chrysophthalma]